MNSRFIFKKNEFSMEQGSARFFFELQTPQQTYNFTEILTFPRPFILAKNLDRIGQEGLTPFLDALFLILGISYWKTFCPRIIETPTIQLTNDQTFFWNTVYTKGLGEFFYKNKIDYKRLVKFPYLNSDITGKSGQMKNLIPTDKEILCPSADRTQNDRKKTKNSSKSLLLFGAGKDSIVSAELLKKSGKKFTLLQINTSAVQDDTARITGKERMVITRTLDPQLFNLNNKKGVYNGHIPVTAIWEFIGLFAAALYGYSYIIASNEYSANYGNLEYLGEEINHQWSKSFEFEQLMQDYTEKHISKNIVSFSLLRPFHEIHIAEIFAQYPQYFCYFSSCNTNFKIGDAIHNTASNPNGILKQVQNDKKRWCGKCPKCLFVFILLAALLPKKDVMRIFEKNLFEDETLLPIFKELLGIEKSKPFECVGCPEETKSAMYNAYKQGMYNKDIIMKYFIENITFNYLPIKKATVNIPEEFQNIF